MYRTIVFICLLWVCSVNTSFSQIGHQSNDVNTPSNTKYAITHARIFVNAETYFPNGIILIENGKIVSIGEFVVIPTDATVIDIGYKYIMPAFIELFSDFGIQKSEIKRGDGNQFNSNKNGPYSWNEAIKPENDADNQYLYNISKAEEYMKAGFGLVLSHQKDGIMRGTGSLVLLQPQSENEYIYRQKASTFYSFNKGTSTQDYPSSLMGSIALLRQTLLDASWYKQAQTMQLDKSLEAYNNTEKLSKIFELNEKYDLDRAYKIAKESNIQFVYKTAGDEYQILSQIKPLNPKLIVPVNFSKPLKPNNPDDWKFVSYQDLLHYESGPTNLYQLYKNQILFSITSSGCNLSSEFYKNIYKAIQAGLPARQALKALTTNSANIIGIDNKVGSLKAGNDAFFIITSDSLGAKSFEVLENWSMNKRTVFHSAKIKDYRGKYIYDVNGKKDTMVITGSISSPDVSYLKEKVKLKIQLDKTSMTFSKFNLTFATLYDQSYTWKVTEEEGGVVRENSLTYIGAIEDSVQKLVMNFKPLFPFVDYSDTIVSHSAKKTLFKNATVWTAENQGVLTNTDVLVNGKGKIEAIKKDISCADCEIVDATGKHISPGIIDEHSHIAIMNGVNEGTQSVTSEVRIGDVLYPEDINIYRQLAGGVTTSHLLHGSANCIGGQTQLIKLKWGQSADELKMPGWEGFIKFALGENVKQSNWGDRSNVRYPQTRMGVQQVMIDAFMRAKEYKKDWQLYTQGKTKIQPRRDLELEALVEILEDNRHITCHSYVQSEINMLMHVADSMGFKVNTFTHILEGYKVADKMKKHGVAASTFADWWAYKYEVMEAIPYNAFILNKMGVVTSVNSDDAEMARRLNQEAAKSMKYGKMSDTNCIKLCTINPAKMLHIDNHTGSIKEGKDADLVIWSNNPLSIEAKVLKTYIDGVCYYDIDRNGYLQNLMEQNRKRIIAKMMEAVKNGEAPETPENKPQKLYNCREDEF